MWQSLPTVSTADPAPRELEWLVGYVTVSAYCLHSRPSSQRTGAVSWLWKNVTVFAYCLHSRSSSKRTGVVSWLVLGFWHPVSHIGLPRDWRGEVVHPKSDNFSPLPRLFLRVLWVWQQQGWSWCHLVPSFEDHKTCKRLKRMIFNQTKQDRVQIFKEILFSNATKNTITK